MDSASFEVMDTIVVLPLDVGGNNLPSEIVSRYMTSKLRLSDTFFFGNKDHLSIDFSLPKRCYVKGERLAFDLVIENLTNSAVSSVTISLLTTVMIFIDTRCSSSVEATPINETHVIVSPFSCKKGLVRVELPRTPLTSCQDSLLHCSFELSIAVNFANSSQRQSAQFRCPIFILRNRQSSSVSHIPSFLPPESIPAADKIRLPDGSVYEV
jgi:hypothetical protein